MRTTDARLRIIGGKFKRRKIAFNTQDLQLRPSLDRVRETVFNWLAPDILEANCLDLFAGSGIFGFEALSRGANFVCCVEHNPVTCERIIYNKKNLQLTATQLSVVNQDVLSFLQDPSNKTPNMQFDLVFLDPPYVNRKLLLESLKILINSKFITKYSKIYFECAKDPWIFSDHNFPVGLELVKSSNTGRIGFYLLQVDDNFLTHSKS